MPRAVFSTRALLLSFLFACFSVVLASDSASELEFSFNTSYFKKYTGEGVVSNPDANLQGELSLSYAGFSAGIFGFFDLTDVLDYRYDVEEWNYFFSYSYSFSELPLLGQVSLELGWTYYDIPRASQDDYQELNFSLTFDDLPLSPALTVNWDYENDSLWFTASCEHSQTLSTISEKLTWDSDLAVHWGNKDWTDSLLGIRKNALATAVLSTGPSWAFNEYASCRIFAELAWGLNGRVRDAMRDDEWNNSCNVNMGVSFDITW